MQRKMIVDYWVDYLDSNSPAIFFKGLANLDTQELRDYIANVEEFCKNSPDQVEIPVEHHFSKGVYAREIKIPAGSLIIGKIHKFENLNILSSGEILIASIEGIEHVIAPYTKVSNAGTKRMLYAITDCVWTTIHGTDLTDVDAIENVFIAKDYSEIELLIKKEI